MHAQRDGHIIQISSIGGRRATPGLGAYQSAKWAVGGFSEVLSREVGPLGIRVTCVEPGGMRTDMFGLSMLASPLAPGLATFGGKVNAVAAETTAYPHRDSPISTSYSVAWGKAEIPRGSRGSSRRRKRVG